MCPAAATTFALPGGGGGGGSVSSVSEASAHPGSSGKSVRPSPSLSAPSEHWGGGGGGGGSVSSVSEASAHPGSAGKSVKPSPSLSAPSEHCGEGGGSEVSTTSRGGSAEASRLLKLTSRAPSHPGAWRNTKLTRPPSATALVTSKLW